MNNLAVLSQRAMMYAYEQGNLHAWCVQLENGDIVILFETMDDKLVAKITVSYLGFTVFCKWPSDLVRFGAWLESLADYL